MMKARTYILAAIAAMLAACAPEELGPTIPVPDNGLEDRLLETPGVRIIDASTTSFKADWKKVPGALEYEYSFSAAGKDGEAEKSVTRDTVLVFSGLEPDCEYSLSLKALPRAESPRLPSRSVTVSIVTNRISKLEAPAPRKGSAFSSMCAFTWGDIAHAECYEWEIEGSPRKGTSIRNFVTVPGLVAGKQYTLRVRALPAEGQADYLASDYGELPFTPESDGSSEVFFDNFTAPFDAICFDVMANAGQYYWYDVIPLSRFQKYASEQEYFDDVKAALDSKADALIAGGMLVTDAYASLLKSGAARIIEPAYSGMAYSVAYAVIDLYGNLVTPFSRKELTTAAEAPVTGPSYREGGDWFDISLDLGKGTAPEYNPNCYFSVTRTGRDVVSVKTAMYVTSTFTRVYGEELTEESLNELRSLLNSKESSADDIIARINNGGATGGYSGLTPGESYTIACLARNNAGEEKLCIESITLRNTAGSLNWVTLKIYDSKNITSSSFKVIIRIDDGFEASSVRFYKGVYSEISASYTPAQYPELIASGASSLAASATTKLNDNRYVVISSSTGLTPATKYLVGIEVTSTEGLKGYSWVTLTTLAEEGR